MLTAEMSDESDAKLPKHKVNPGHMCLLQLAVFILTALAHVHVFHRGKTDSSDLIGRCHRKRKNSETLDQ